jgi:hypothetical protein
MLKQVSLKVHQGDYINIEDVGPVYLKAPTHRYLVNTRTSGAVIGEIKWYSQWRKYAFFPTDAIFEQNCLRDIADFLELVTVEHKHRKWRRYNPLPNPRIVSVTKQVLEENERKRSQTKN